jgi:hypothetical protein
LFPPCRKFDGDVDKEFNRHILFEKFQQLPLLKNLIDTFEKLFPYLSSDMVWLLIKSKPNAGFQRWYKNFALGNKITKTIIVYLRCAMEVGASTLGNAMRVNLTVGSAMGDATLGDVGCTLGAS